MILLRKRAMVALLELCYDCLCSLFCVSSSRCPGLVFRLCLWHFLVIPTVCCEHKYHQNSSKIGVSVEDGERGLMTIHKCLIVLVDLTSWLPQNSPNWRTCCTNGLHFSPTIMLFLDYQRTIDRSDSVQGFLFQFILDFSNHRVVKRGVSRSFYMEPIMY